MRTCSHYFFAVTLEFEGKFPYYCSYVYHSDDPHRRQWHLLSLCPLASILPRGWPGQKSYPREPLSLHTPGSGSDPPCAPIQGRSHRFASPQRRHRDARRPLDRRRLGHLRHRASPGDRNGARHRFRGKLALWQIIARVIDQGSRLSAVRLAQTHAACEVLRCPAVLMRTISTRTWCGWLTIRRPSSAAGSQRGAGL